MRRAIVAVLAFCLVAMMCHAAQARTLVTRVVATVAHDEGLDIPRPDRIYMTFRNPGDGPYPPQYLVTTGYIFSYADLDKFKVAARQLPAGTTVMYDLEGWRFSPGHQLRHSLASMKAFVGTARKYHLKAGLCPAWIILPAGSRYQEGSLSIPADFFILQTHYAPGPQLAALVHRVVKEQPGKVYLKLSAIPQFSMDYLLGEWRTARRYTPNFVVWGGRPRDASSVQKAVDLYKRLEAV